MGNTEMATLKMRRMTRGDIDSVLILCKKVDGKQSRLCYRDLIAMNPGESMDMSFIAEDNGTIVGFVKARLEYMYVPVTEVCLIHALIIDPNYQRRGVGTVLMNELIDSCVINEIGTIRALIDENDTELKVFAENMGFRRGKIINYDRTFEN